MGKTIVFTLQEVNDIIYRFVEALVEKGLLDVHKIVGEDFGGVYPLPPYRELDIKQ